MVVHVWLHTTMATETEPYAFGADCTSHRDVMKKNALRFRIRILARTGRPTNLFLFFCKLIAIDVELAVLRDACDEEMCRN